MPDTTVLKSETVGTVRTTTNVTVMAAILALIAKFTNWNVQADDLLPYVPIIVPVVAVFYRASLALAKKFPGLGVILYGINAPPAYHPPAPPLNPDDVILPPDKGFAYNSVLGTILIVLAIVAVLIFIFMHVDITTK